MPAESAAVCAGVVKIYWTATGEVHALKGIDAAFARRAVTAVVGPSGSGKSSLLRILAGLDRPTAGSVRIGDEELGGMRRRDLRRLRRTRTGYVFQRPADNLISYLTVGQHVEAAARIRGLDEGETAASGHLLRLLGLWERRDHLPRQLSGGEQQRLGFAQAVVGSPDLIVADEPTAELDSGSARDLLDVVTSLAREGFGSFVVSTHDPEVEAAADATLHLRHGALEAESREARRLSVIDAFGRVQLPPEALGMFPDSRAVIEVGEDDVRITPP